MKQLLSPLTILTLTFTGFSLQQAGWLTPPSPRHAEVHRASANPYTSDAAYRHRTCQPTHWRAMLLQR